jgi:hypothetical protein
VVGAAVAGAVVVPAGVAAGSAPGRLGISDAANRGSSSSRIAS